MKEEFIYMFSSDGYRDSLNLDYYFNTIEEWLNNLQFLLEEGGVILDDEKITLVEKVEEWKWFIDFKIEITDEYWYKSKREISFFKIAKFSK